MAFIKLPRLAVNWNSQPEMLRRYMDQVMNAVEELRTLYTNLQSLASELNSSPVAVGSLPASPTVRRRIVTDSSVTTFNSIVVGGGSDILPVFFDGTNWRVG